MLTECHINLVYICINFINILFLFFGRFFENSRESLEAKIFYVSVVDVFLNHALLRKCYFP